MLKLRCSAEGEGLVRVVYSGEYNGLFKTSEGSPEEVFAEVTNYARQQAHPPIYLEVTTDFPDTTEYINFFKGLFETELPSLKYIFPRNKDTIRINGKSRGVKFE